MNPLARRYVKHATLIERCFPLEKASNAVPNSNELSYLVYYTQSKPAKLTKVGAYLSKRVSRDAQKRRYADVHVALCIFDALLDSCGRDLHFFARDVLASLDTALSANSFVLSKASVHTFTIFCKQHTGSTLAIDKELCSLYSGLIRKFASFAKKYDGKGAIDSSRIALGLCAIQAVAESQATYANDCYYELPCVVKTIAACVARFSAPEGPADSTPVADRIGRIDGNPGSAPSNAVLGSWAWECLETLVRSSHGQHSHVIVAEIFKQLDRSFQWQPVPLCVQIVTKVIGLLQPQDRNMVIVEVLGLLTNGMHKSNLYLSGAMDSDVNVLRRLRATESQLKDGPSQAQTADNRKETSRQMCIIRILECLFCQPHVLVGISVMDVLNVLVTFLLESVVDKQLTSPDSRMFSAVLEAASTGSEFDISGEQEAPEKYSNYYHLLAGIGSLARHHYYSSQIADMVEYLVQKMRLRWSGSPKTVDQNKHSARQHWLIQVLYIVLVSGGVGREKPTNSFVLPFKAFAPIFTLVSHEDQIIRTQAADCIIIILRHNHANAAAQESDSSWRPELADAIYRKIGGQLIQEHQAGSTLTNIASYAAITGILCGLLCAQRNYTVQHTLVLADSCAPVDVDQAWVTLLAMVYKQTAFLSLSDNAKATISTLVERTKESGFWNSDIEDVCLNRSSAISIYNSRANVDAVVSANKGAADICNKDSASLFIKTLNHESILDMLGADIATQCDNLRARQGNIDKDYWKADSESVNRILCNSGDGGVSTKEAQNSASQVKDIRARVSVDWEAQVRRDSMLAPYVNVDQLRAALRDGLSAHSSEQQLGGPGLGNHRARVTANSNISKSSVYNPQSASRVATARSVDGSAAIGDEFRGNDEYLDMHGQPVPDDVRDLLDSIDIDDYDATTSIVNEFPLHALSESRDNTHSSSTISTPVIGNVE
ncbi:plasma membrane localization protein [Coemansia sp. RSA 1813]|nr:plasma membrane localization protein [Coemansia sp. RSA 1843]KAJ2090459.1 plasma membrane localization protein [Coemansia sp. RSA 986]KAJ2215426.1 plasma membrane localization protein [Coemansia sp. RSA 487]KAJ2570015.1 plasma membrane localization protein [Coemansia sp. RSA 1813]